MSKLVFSQLVSLKGETDAIGNLKDTHLSDFFRRVAYRKGRATAVSATARKLGVIILTMITNKVAYTPPTKYLFLDEKRKLKLVQRMKKNIAKFDLTPQHVEFVAT